jgi:hypothetical protein
MNSKLLRTLIREMLNEDYSVSIVASPIGSGKKLKRGEKPPADRLANVVLSTSDFEDFIKIANERDILNQMGDEDDQEIKKRVDEIGRRVSGAAANLARILVKKSKALEPSDPSHASNVFFNMPDEDGIVNLTHPALGRTYDVPELFRQMAMVEKPGAKGVAVGKGEALAILMFGRAESAGPEPDLIVSDTLKFSIKFFEGKSNTVYVSAGLGDTPGVKTLIDQTRTLREIAAKKELHASGKNMSRLQVKKMLAAIHDDITQNIAPAARRTTMYSYSTSARADLDPSGIAGDDVNAALTAQAVLDIVMQTGNLWDTISFSQYPILALLGGSDMKFIAEPAEDCRLGAIDFGKSESIPELKVASPANARIKVTPGTSSADDTL